MISKELLSEVLKGTIQEFKINNEGNVDFIFIGDYDEWKTINIYELANKCKEWALNKHDYGISTYWNKDEKVFVSLIMENWMSDNYSMDADTEPEAIFKACSYILEQNRAIF